MHLDVLEHKHMQIIKANTQLKKQKSKSMWEKLKKMKFENTSFYQNIMMTFTWTLAQMFSYEICEIFPFIFFTVHLSESYQEYR